WLLGGAADCPLSKEAVAVAPLVPSLRLIPPLPLVARVTAVAATQGVTPKHRRRLVRAFHPHAPPGRRGVHTEPITARLSYPSPTVAAVFVAGDRIIYSASDLAAAARCEYALLRDFDAKLGRGPAVPADDELLARTASLGNEHERRRLDQLRDEFGGDVAVIGRPAYTLAGFAAAAEATQRAIEKRAPVVYQAAMFDGRFVGFADFLIR